jgi:hypothetical protein
MLNFSRTGRIIRSDPEFSNSFTKKLESFLANRAANAHEIFEDIDASEWRGRPSWQKE